MRIATLFDIHGNLPAVEAVLADVRAAGVDRLVVGGDIVVGPMTREALAYMRALDLPVEFIYGNCDVAVLDQGTGLEVSIHSHFEVVLTSLINSSRSSRNPNYSEGSLYVF